MQKNELATERTIEVAIVDDHAIMRSGLKMLINDQPDMRVVAEAGNASDVLPIVARSKPQILLLDISLRGASGLSLLKGLSREHPRTRVVILTMHNKVALLRTALAEGASGFVSKQAADVELLSAIRAVSKGGLFIDPTLAAAFVRDQLASPSAASRVLSRREDELVRWIAEGYGTQEIARRMHVSVKTVETYRARVAEKLGLKSRHDITRYALLTGMLSSEDLERGELAS